MKIHEYQAKELFHAYGIPAPEGMVAATADEAHEAARKLGLPVVLKAQVHTGGRGKAGGVKIVSNDDQVGAFAEEILKLTIKDLPVRKVLVTPAVEIATEVYLSILVDRGARSAVFIGCAEGGVEIEVTAKESPDKILRLEVPSTQLRDLPADTCRVFASKLFPDAGQAEQAIAVMQKMARLFIEKDCSLVEINPLIVDGEGRVIALDAKVLLDDNALFRHPELEDLRDMDSEDADELDAKAAGLSFIRLDGNIGCMVNGAGLAMATMDTIKHFDGQPANFLDVGGSSNPAKVVHAFKTILKDPDVKVILINIFGGITRCDDIAQGIVQSLEEVELPVPLVVRLKGTNEEEGRTLLEQAEVPSGLHTAQTLEEGATRAAELGGKS
jgi:succinyl-CoA synthetase beta subunit